ncbi:MoaF N-terminal domain-containing protein [Thermodesulfobacteriota bacterium]
MLMHRYEYTELTGEQIDEKLVPAKTGPECVSEYSDILAGKSLKIITDNGPALIYDFKDKKNLSLTENKGNSVKTAYGALTLKHAVLFSHMIPGTQKGYIITVNQKTKLVTVVEVWFSGYKDNREVQRELYHGYLDTGGAPPADRHHTTNRISGKGFHWINDRGIETLEFFPSVTYSSFVELTRHDDELLYCAPADYIEIDENIFLYDRVECEFSGIMTMYIVDLFTLKQAGVRLGFNEKDELEYYMYRGKGEITGQIAQFHRPDNHGKKIIYELESPPPPEDKEPPPKPPAEKPPKGFRPVYRPLGDHPPMSEEEVHQTVQKSPAPFSGAGIMDSGFGGNKLPVSDFLVGKEFTLRYDNGGPAWKYKFNDINKLQYCCEGENNWHDEPYESFEPAEDMIVFCNPHSNARPHESVIIVLDFGDSLTTCVNSKLGTQYMANEVSQEVIFGVIEMEGFKEAPALLRHGFTEELVGCSLTWSYSDYMTSVHVYSTPFSYSWTIFYKDGVPGMMWSSPCKYVKLREDTYLFTWVEEACNGSQGTFVFNKRTMHDCGYFYGINEIKDKPDPMGPSGLTLGSFGALARTAGYYEVKKFFGPKV